jgi:hypothetical protein
MRLGTGCMTFRRILRQTTDKLLKLVEPDVRTYAKALCGRASFVRLHSRKRVAQEHCIKEYHYHQSHTVEGYHIAESRTE